MDALISRFALTAMILLYGADVCQAATVRTRNFVVTAATSDEARTVGEAAEHYRTELAEYWIGRPLKNWQRPCQIKVESGHYGASGKTTFQFAGTEVFGWRMTVRGTPERILDSVLPHEVNHTIFACYFRRPLPRWADEGAATLFEHPSEQRLQLELLKSVVDSPREFIPLKRLLSMKEYPRGHRPMLIMYAEGFAMVDFLIQQKGKETYLKFLADGHRNGWEAAIKRHYNHAGIGVLQNDWRAWVKAGMPRYDSAPEVLLTATPASDRGAARPVALERRAEVGNKPTRSATPTSRFDDRNDDHREPSARSLSPETSRFYEPNHTKYSKNRRASVEAPSPDPGRNARTVQQDPYFRSDRVSGSRRQRTQLEPTNHRSDGSERKSFNEDPWERNRETGSIPQWADFPGQTGSF